MSFTLFVTCHIFPIVAEEENHLGNYFGLVKESEAKSSLVAEIQIINGDP